MKKTTKTIHFLIRIFNLESFLIALFIRTSNKIIKKLIPLHTSYMHPSIKKVIRDSTIFELDISDYMQWHIWSGLKDLSWKFATKDAKGPCTIIDVVAFCLKTGVFLVNNNIDLTVNTISPFHFNGFGMGMNEKVTAFLAENKKRYPLRTGKDKKKAMSSYYFFLTQNSKSCFESLKYLFLTVLKDFKNPKFKHWVKFKLKRA